MTELIAVGAGGALGSIARYLVNMLAVQLFGTAFPVGVLTVNVLGSLAIGVFVEYLILTNNLNIHLRLFVAVGVMGGFTTFSTFSLDVAALYERGEWVLSVIYVFASVLLSIAALFLGLYIARRYFSGLV